MQRRAAPCCPLDARHPPPPRLQQEFTIQCYVVPRCVSFHRNAPAYRAPRKDVIDYTDRPRAEILRLV